MTVAGAHQIVGQLLSLVAHGPCEEMADLFAEDAVFEMPYLPPGVPAQEPGRETFRAHLREGALVQRFDAVTDARIHQTADPEVVIAEYRLHGTVTATGRRFASDLVMVARVRDGLIVSHRSYANPLDAAVAFGAVGDLLTALAG
ncbi:nuclear transport factor 2 family protein [Nonomuraea sp. CA-141351]|uniref:nuclear transport factor 2 family protein n=1 Tax=Nonomuraea sp. CA-141351 TaxID=3239996 RepID=UPI003D89F40D